MHDGYRGLAFTALIAALLLAFGLGLYVSGLNYPDEGYQTYHTSQNDKEGTATPVANVATAIVERTPCDQPQSETESNLCAQWRAAQAAEKSAEWTVYGFWATLAGMALLTWQIVLTRKAVKDTSEATAAMRKANEIAYVTQRPWIEIKAEIFNFKCVDRRYIEFDWRVKFKNIGRMSAENFHSVVRCEVIGFDVVSETGFYFDKFTENDVLQDVAIIPSGEYDYFGKTSHVLSTMPWVEREDFGRQCLILLMVMSKYKVPGETKWRHAMQSYSIGQNRDVVDNRYLAYDFPDDISANDMTVLRIGRKRAT